MKGMKKIPLPVIVAVVIVAVLLAYYSIHRSMSGGLPSPPSIPTGPPAEAMKQMQQSGAQTHGGPAGGAPQAASQTK
ncbi:MAG TPA: hypothetical protein VFB38_14040 [Chthonomonadaceae bacterium]|nr:hypothetical protein [Chthonomonadaceae bacterium]